MENTITNNNMVDMNEFVEKYKMCKNDTQRSALLAKLEIKTYIPYTLKVNVAKGAIAEECVKEEGFYSNSERRYLAFALSIVMLYTNLSIPKSVDSSIYDDIKSCGLLDDIIAVANKSKDIDEFRLLWGMIYNDLYEQNNSLNAIVGQQVVRAAAVCNVGMYKLGESIENFDFEKLGKNISTYLPVIQTILKMTNNK